MCVNCLRPSRLLTSYQAVSDSYNKQSCTLPRDIECQQAMTITTDRGAHLLLEAYCLHRMRPASQEPLRRSSDPCSDHVLNAVAGLTLNVDCIGCSLNWPATEAKLVGVNADQCVQSCSGCTLHDVKPRDILATGTVGYTAGYMGHSLNLLSHLSCKHAVLQ